MNKCKGYTIINWYLFAGLYLSYLVWPDYFKSPLPVEAKIQEIEIKVRSFTNQYDESLTLLENVSLSEKNTIVAWGY